MVASIHQIIGKVNPKTYAENGEELLKEYGSPDKIPADDIKPKPLAEHKLVYDSSSETLEPIYFWLLDLMNDLGLGPEKLIDNFTSSPGSGHFSELGQKASVMQQQASRILGDANNVLRSILNLIYDLKEFKIRLEHYDNLSSKDKEKRSAATLSLKQIWMDKVDYPQKANASIKAMAMQGGFQTLLDAFLVADDEKPLSELDLNDRVKRIVKQRLGEFNIWLRESEKELRKRYEVEKNYLKSQVNSIKLYSRWAKPYLRAAQQLEMKENSKEPALVKAFNTIILELALLGKSKIKIEDSVAEEKLPKDFKKVKMKRDYYGCVVVEFKFRGIPQKISQQSHYVFGGRTEITFTAYSLNDDELKMIEKEMGESDVDDMLKLIQGSTTESLEQLKEDIDEFIKEKPKEESQKEKRKKENEGANPFLALLGFYDKDDKKEDKKSKDKKEEIKFARFDDSLEKEYVRPLADETAKDKAFTVFDIYKKAHGMPSYT